MTDLRTGVLAGTAREGRSAVGHLHVQAALIGGRMVRAHHTLEEREDFASRLTEKLVRTLNAPLCKDAMALEQDFQQRVQLLMRRVFTEWKAASERDVMGHLSGSDVDVDGFSGGGDPEAILIGRQEEEARKAGEEARKAMEEARRAGEALLGKPAVDILPLHDGGKSNVEIAKLLKLSEGAVRYHLRKHRPEAARRRTK